MFIRPGGLVNPPSRVDQSGSLSPGSPAAAGEPGVIHGLIRHGGSVTGNIRVY